MGEQISKQNEVIVVLGAGRTGTSLLTNILNRLGMSISKSEIPLSEQNPAGFFEDADIVAIHREILSRVRCHAYLPLPVDFMKMEGVNSFVSKLKDIVLDNLSKTSSLWGFKDPRTPSLLPVWMRVFNSGKIIPTYVLSVRDPKSVVESMRKQYSDSPQIAELTWLHRNCEALYQTGGNCFVVHYEDWFTEKAPEIGKQLLQYTGLDHFWNKGQSVSGAVTSVVKPNLNRAVYNDYEVNNRYVLKLYNALLQCHGDQFDRQALMDVVMECRKAMAEFSGWSMMAQRFFRQQGSLSQAQFKETPKKAVEEANRYILECKDFADENEHLRVRLSVQAKEFQGIQKDLQKIEQAQKKEKQQTKRNKRKIFMLQTSTSFQVGQILVNAVAKPGKSTIFAPFYLIRTILASRVVKK